MGAARGGTFEGPDDSRLFHTLELIGMAVSFRDLLSRLDMMPMMSESQSGLLGMLGSAVGLWSNWRKVCKDQCGTKTFSPVMKRPFSAPSLHKTCLFTCDETTDSSITLPRCEH